MKASCEMRVDHPFIEDLLHPGQDFRALAVVQFDRLLLEHRIEIRVTAIDVGAALHDTSNRVAALPNEPLPA